MINQLLILRTPIS